MHAETHHHPRLLRGRRGALPCPLPPAARVRCATASGLDGCCAAQEGRTPLHDFLTIAYLDEPKHTDSVLWADNGDGTVGALLDLGADPAAVANDGTSILHLVVKGKDGYLGPVGFKALKVLLRAARERESSLGAFGDKPRAAVRCCGVFSFNLVGRRAAAARLNVSASRRQHSSPSRAIQSVCTTPLTLRGTDPSDRKSVV